MARIPGLRSARDFARVAREGSRARRDGVTVMALATGHERSRLGLAVPAATGTAVARNRLRRRLREIFRAEGPREGFDVVLRVGPEASGRSFGELRDLTKEALSAALDRAAA